MMQIPAIGRVVRFGDIYDARTNKFTGINAFQIKLDKSYIDPVENRNSSYKFSFATRESEKLDAMDISGELKINILCGLIELGGSAKYIKNDKHSKKCIQCSYILKSTTKKESINWNLKEFSKHFDFDGIEGTHMVVGIQYGGNAVVTLRYTSDEIENSSEIQGNLKAQLAKITKVSGELNVAGKIDDREKISENELNISVEADVSLEGEDVTKIEGATKFLQSLSTKLQKYNDGKGVQVGFEMIPLEQIFKRLKMQICEAQIYRVLDNGIMVDIIREVDELEKAKEEFVQHIIKLENDKEYFSKTEYEWLYDEKTKFEILISDIQVNIAKILKLFHDQEPSARTELNEQSARISKLKKDIYEFNEKSDDLVTKAEFIKKAKSSKVLYISQKSKFDSYKWQMKTLCICLFSKKYYRENLNLLIQFMHDSNSNKSENIYILLDTDILCDFVKNELKMDEIPRNPLVFYVNGKYQGGEDDYGEVIIGISVHGVSCYANYYKNHQFHEFVVEGFSKECLDRIDFEESSEVQQLAVTLHILKTKVEKELKKEIENVILTECDDNEEDLLNACRILDLNVLHVLYEPAAVSLTHLISTKTTEKKIFYYCNFLEGRATLNIEYYKIELTDFETSDDDSIEKVLESIISEIIVAKIIEKFPYIENNEENAIRILSKIETIVEAFINGEENVTVEENFDNTHISILISKEHIEKIFDKNYKDFFESVASTVKENSEIDEIFVVGNFGSIPFIQNKITQMISTTKLTFLPSNTGAKGAAIYGAALLGHFKKYTTSYKRDISFKESPELDNWTREKFSKFEICLNADGRMERKFINVISNKFDVEEEKAEFKNNITKLKQKKQDL